MTTATTTLLHGPFGAELLHAGGDVSVVEHPIAPRTLAGPSHVHLNEDEYSYVLEGEVGFEIGDEVGVPHAFWNATDEPARVLELIVPGGFEQYFSELSELIPPALPSPDVEGLARLQERYGVEMDFGSIERLTREHGLGSA